MLISPHAILSNDLTPPPGEVLLGCNVGDFARLSAGMMLLQGGRVGSHSLVAAKALVTKYVPPYLITAGVPARIIGEASSIKLRDGSGSQLVRGRLTLPEVTLKKLLRNLWATSP